MQESQKSWARSQISISQAAHQERHADITLNLKATCPPKKKHRTKGPVDDLNSWNFCDPDKFVDVLPWPYSMVSTVLEEDILQNVDEKIYEIELMKHNPSYEGGLKKIAPSGTFDIDKIVAISNEASTEELSFAGDMLGKLYMLDIQRKLMNFKMELKEKNPVISISAQRFGYGNTYIYYISVVQKAIKNIDIYIYIHGEKEAVLYNTICSKNYNFEEKEDLPNNARSQPKKPKGKDEDQTDAEQTILPKKYLCEFPRTAKISDRGDYIYVTYFNGDLEVYELGILPIIIPYIGIDERADILLNQEKSSAGEFDLGELRKLPPLNNLIRKRGLNSTSEITPKKYVTPLIHKKCEREPIKRDLEGFIEKLKDQKKQTEDAAELEKANINKKAPPKGKEKKGTKPKTTKDEEPEEEDQDVPYVDEFEENTKIELLGLEDEIKLIPKYYPEIYFIESEDIYKYEDIYDTLKEEQHKINQKDVNLDEKAEKPDDLLLSKPFLVKRTTEIAVAWKNTKKFQIISLENSIKNAGMVPLRIKKKFLHFYKNIDKYLDIEENKSNKEGVTLTFQTFKRISCSSISLKKKYLSLGCQNGSVLLWDFTMNTFSKTLDKHHKGVSCLGFYNDSILVSGGEDGHVHMYDILGKDSGDKSLFMNQKNFFTIMSKDKHYEDENSIVAMNVSSSGLVFTIDSLNNGRIYSVFHGTKIYKVNPGYNFSLDVLNGSPAIYSKYKVVPRSIMQSENSSLVVVSDKYRSRQSEEKIGSMLVIYKFADNLLNIFPSLRNSLKKGLDKENVIRAFSLMMIEDLKKEDGFVPKIYYDGRPDHPHSPLKSRYAGSKTGSRGTSNKRNTTSSNFKSNSIKSKKNREESIKNPLNETANTFGGVTEANTSLASFMGRTPIETLKMINSSTLKNTGVVSDYNQFDQEGTINPVKNTYRSMFTRVGEMFLRSRNMDKFRRQLSSKMEEQMLKERQERINAGL